MNGRAPGTVENLVAGEWQRHDGQYDEIVDPMNGEAFLRVPDTTEFAIVHLRPSSPAPNQGCTIR